MNVPSEEGELDRPVEYVKNAQKYWCVRGYVGLYGVVWGCVGLCEIV